jgi:hypothetical protein
MEKEVKNLIKDSLFKRLVGHDEIDTILTNDALVEKWLTGIVALGYNDSDVEKAAQDIYEMKSALLGEISIEDIRALVYLVNYRFAEEIMAFRRYVELRNEEDSKILSNVKEELNLVEEGNFLLT